MNYDLETVDYIFDLFNYTLFTMKLDPNSTPMEQWEDGLVPFQFSGVQFADWLKSNWAIESEQFETEKMIYSPNYNWTIEIDFYRGIPEKSKLIQIDGSYKLDKTIIYFKSQSLFLFEFAVKISAFFRIDRIFISVGSDLHIVEYNRNTNKVDFLKEIHSHHTRFD